MADWYVDFSAANDGDGTAYTQAAGAGLTGAYNTVVGKTFSTGDMVWMRRTPAKTIASTWNSTSPGVYYIGWPLSGDNFYSSRPLLPQATWDADSETYAYLQVGAANVLTMNSQADGCEFHRIRLDGSTTNSQYTLTPTHPQKSEYFNCYFYSSYYTSSTIGITSGIQYFHNCTVNNNVALGTGQIAALYLVGGGFCHFYNSTIIGQWAVFNVFNGNGNLLLSNCVLQPSGQNNTNGIISWGFGILTMFDCTVYGPASYIESGPPTDTIYYNGAGTYSGIYAYNLKVDRATDINLEGSNSTGGYIHLSQFNQTTASATYGIDLGNSAANNGRWVIIADNPVFHPNNRLGDVRLNPGSVCVLRNPTFYHQNPVALNGSLSLEIQDEVRLGALESYAGQKRVSTSSVYRNGGARYSLALQSDFPNAMFAPALNIPGMERYWFNLPARAVTVTVYGAHKAETGRVPTKDKLWFWCSYLDSATGGSRSVASSIGSGAQQALDSDASTWTGDAGLTPFKMSVTFTCGQACLSAAVICNTYPIDDGVIYIDPQVQVT